MAVRIPPENVRLDPATPPENQGPNVDIDDMIVSNGPPNGAVGENGQVCFDYVNKAFWGPKNAGSWGGSPLALAGSSALTTKGDLSVFTTQADRLPIGPDGTVPVADSTQATGLKYVPLVAMWDPTKARYFFLDYEAGNDANAGYLDAPPGTVFTSGQVDAVKIKTFTRLKQIIPYLGNNRIAVVLVKFRPAAATYLDDDGVTATEMDWTPYTGYKILLKRGSTDLTNSVADRAQCGFVTLIAGPGASGEWTVTTGGTTTSFTVASGTLTAEAAVGARARFTGNVTSGLANVNVMIRQNTTTVLTTTSTGTAPANGDTFFIEVPGAIVDKWIVNSTHGGEDINTSTARMSSLTIGIGVANAAADSMRFTGIAEWVSGIETTSTSSAANQLVVANIQSFGCRSAWLDETGASRATGFGARVRGAFIFRRISSLFLTEFGWAKASVAEGVRFQGITGAPAAIGSNSVFMSPIQLSQCRTHTSGSQAGVLASFRSVGGLTLANGSIMNLNAIAFESCTTACIRFIQDVRGATVLIQSCTGSTGNTSVVFSALNGCTNCTFIFSGNTVTATGGDIITSDNALATFAGLALTNVVDKNGNSYQDATLGRIVDTCVPVTNQSGGALSVGQIVRSNGTSGQVTKAQADTAANATAIGVMVTAPANAALGYMAMMGTPYVLFDATPTAGSLLYLSAGTAGNATTTLPAASGTNQRQRLGRVINVVSTHGRVVWRPELVPTTSDGTTA